MMTARTRLTDLRIERWGALRALQMAPVAAVNLITGANGIGKSALLDAVAALLRDGAAAEPADSPPRLHMRREDDGILRAAEAAGIAVHGRDAAQRGERATLDRAGIKPDPRLSPRAATRPVRFCLLKRHINRSPVSGDEVQLRLPCMG